MVGCRKTSVSKYLSPVAASLLPEDCPQEGGDNLPFVADDPKLTTVYLINYFHRQYLTFILS